jgi:UDP-glucose 4-epimerase
MGHRVVVVDDLSGGFEENIPKEAEFFPWDITEPVLVEELFKQVRPDYVYHFACYAAEGLSHFIKRFNYGNNLLGSVNLINCAVNYEVKCFVFTSSMAVYGSQQVPFREEMIPMPEDSYGIAKYAVERELEISHKMFRLPYVIFRPHNVFGERQNIGDKYRNVVGIFMNQCLKGEPMTIFGNGNQMRAFSYVGGVAPIISECVDNPKALNRTFNIGSDYPITVNQLSEDVATVMKYPWRVARFDVRQEVAKAFCDHSKLERVFGEIKSLSHMAALLRMAEWVKEHGARQSKEFKDIEITKNLPPSWVHA